MQMFVKRSMQVAVFAFLLVAVSLNAQVRQATDDAGNKLKVAGSVVIVDPDIELYVLTAGGLMEPNKEWSEAARRNYPAAVREVLEQADIEHKPDFDIPDGLQPSSRLGQIVRLNEAVAISIAQTSWAGSQLATKKDPNTGRYRMDWTLGPGVTELKTQTGADYALFTYVRDSYASGGRKALRILGFLAGAAMGTVTDIGGGTQFGVALLVDLNSGQVVWFNLIAREHGDLRDQESAKRTVDALLKKLPL